MANFGQLCQLCGMKSKSGIEIFGHVGVELSMQSILIQHFPIEVCAIKDIKFLNIIQSDDGSKIICKKCWKITDAFHQLYCLVKDVIVFKYNKSPIQLSQILQTKVNNEQSIEKFDFIEVKLESHDFNLHQDDVRPIPKPKTESKFEIKEENSQNKHNETEDYLTSPSMKEKSDIQTKQLTAKQLQTIEQDNEIHNSLAIVCELCDTTCTTFVELKQHFQKKHKVAGYIRCCGRKYKYRSELYEHIRDHKNPIHMQCSVCEKTFIDSGKLKIHMKRHVPKFKKFQCLKCPKSFTTIWYLNEHIKCMHFNGPKTFICDICGKSFNSKFTVTNHLVAVHVKRNSRICDMCGKSFITEKLLDVHYKVQHLGIRLPKVQCNVCETWLGDKNILRKHMRYHYAKEEPCSICGRKTPNRNALRTHMRIVHSGQIFPCTMCTKKFKSQKSLTEHFSTHTGFKLHQCKYCLMEFNYESSLYKHRKDVHPVEVEEDRKQKMCNIKIPFKRVEKIQKL